MAGCSGIGIVGLGGLGGSGRVAHDLAAELARLGHRVVSLTCGGCQFGPEISAWVEHVPVRAPRTPRPAEDGWVRALADDLEQAVEAHQLEVLSVHYGVGLAEAALEARRRLRARGKAVRVCVTLHGTDVTELGREPGQVSRLREALEQADAVSVVSRWLEQEASQWGLLRRAAAVIPNGVDTDVFVPAPAASRPARLVHASNFRPIKRPLDAVELVASLRDRDVEAHLEMIGDGPLRPAAADRARALEVEDRVEFVAPLSQRELAERIRGATMAVVTSESESFGLFAVESMASGLLVAGWRSAGLAGTLSSDPGLVDALLVRLGDLPALTQRVATVLCDPALRADLVARSTTLGRTRYARGRQVEGYRRLFGIERRERWDWPRDARI